MKKLALIVALFVVLAVLVGQARSDSTPGGSYGVHGLSCYKLPGTEAKRNRCIEQRTVDREIADVDMSLEMAKLRARVTALETEVAALKAKVG